jgi:crotonobetainyl-CoA:carnitine CoA-transferase CaiB-like acyl-CoA transferase
MSEPGGSATGPLSGYKVLDLSIAATGPYACAMLADQGAEVLKVERPGMGDIGRWIGVQIGGISALHQMCNRGKRGIAVSIDLEEGRDLVRRLAADSDVVVQNWRPGVADRLGIGYEDLRHHEARRNELVYVSISGFGDVGPYAHKGAYDTVIQAYAGVGISETDPDSGTPRFVRQVLADKVTALTASQAITAALLARERGHGGQHVKLSMMDAVISFMWIDAAGNEVIRDGDGSQPGSFAASSRPFRFTDGWGVCTPTANADFFGMCRAFGVDGWDDPRIASPALRYKNRDVTGPLMQRCHEVAATLTTAEAIARMEAEKVPCGVVLSAAELGADPHVTEVGMLVDTVHPVAGNIRQPRPAAQFSATPSQLGGPAPTLGQHTDDVLAELGLSPTDIARLRAENVVA